MSEAILVFVDRKQESMDRRANNRENSASILEEKGIKFERKNMGAHLIVHGQVIVVDFWPGTGKWIVRGTGKTGRGVFNLLKLPGL